jgi:hypothetical protein
MISQNYKALRGIDKIKKIMQKRVLPYKMAEEEGFEPSIEV